MRKVSLRKFLVVGLAAPAVLLVRCVGDDGTANDAGPDVTVDGGGPDVTGKDGGPGDAASDGDGGPTCVVPDSGAHGSLDSTFSTAALTSITNNFGASAIAIDTTGNVYVAGSASGGSCGTLDFALVRLKPNGDVDTTFNASNAPKCYSLDASGIGAAYAVAIDSQGRIVMGGIAGHSGHYFAGIVRVDGTGALDTSFNGSGLLDVLGPDAGVAAGSGNGFVTIYGIAIAPGDKVVVSGTDDNGGAGSSAWKSGYVARLTSGGALDLTFGTSGLYTDATVHGYWGVTADATGAVATVGYDKSTPGHMVVRKLTSGGAPDGTFGGGDAGLATLPAFVDGGANDVGRSLIALPSGKLLAAGAVNAAGTAGVAGVALLQANGVLDPSFAGGDAVYSNINFFGFYMTSALASLCDGRMFLAGEIGADPDQNIVVTKLLANGTIDTSFGTSGITTIAVTGNQLPAQMAQDPITGKLVVVGGTGGQTVVARINP